VVQQGRPFVAAETLESLLAKIIEDDPVDESLRTQSEAVRDVRIRKIIALVEELLRARDRIDEQVLQALGGSDTRFARRAQPPLGLRELVPERAAGTAINVT
jgi:hypothetical protein